MCRRYMYQERYKKYYKIDDFYDPKNYDYVVDSSHIDAKHVADKIVKFIRSKLTEAVKQSLDRKENV